MKITSFKVPEAPDAKRLLEDLNQEQKYTKMTDMTQASSLQKTEKENYKVQLSETVLLTARALEGSISHEMQKVSCFGAVALRDAAGKKTVSAPNVNSGTE